MVLFFWPPTRAPRNLMLQQTLEYVNVQEARNAGSDSGTSQRLPVGPPSGTTTNNVRIHSYPQWTTGEAPSLNLLFKYLKIKFYLPTDTTNHNQLSKIFVELHGKIVWEFAVRYWFYSCVPSSASLIPFRPERKIKNCICN